MDARERVVAAIIRRTKFSMVMVDMVGGRIKLEEI